ncbi:triose-phosphate / phosphate translocator [Klebsormidium nitens]|uniref:Triose-phosphate / phosphate translocator n=1 Tax=Klebsormidium nitens TaxID=105231 RepID=A0A1Y1I5U2_KLENI|nr:triose-phosphate / phosphate translocator [Klebsormidium nitens]|eukprot:GAQ84086.1 triose-phosphate / phosphate translocator [Klebsormidium nitens]
MEAVVSEAASLPDPGVPSAPAETPPLELGLYFILWYILNVFFNILNKQLYGYFPFPWFVSTVHLAVGVLYCTIAWGLNMPKRVELSGDEIKALVPISAAHAFGHLMTNVSFASVAVSFTHTIKALEPFFSAVGQYLVFGETISLPLLLSLLPIVGGVSAASMTELSFNWTGFTGAMIANLLFTYRNLIGKKAMIKKLDSTNLYAYISIIALCFCIPATFVMEGKVLIPGIKAAVSKVGARKFVQDLLLVGFFYHTYNQVQFNCLEKVNPVTHAVGNVAKRIFVIGFSLLVFKNPVTKQTAVGTAVAIAGCSIYSLLKAKEKEAALKAKAA